MKCAVYVHEIVKLCSKMCLTNTIDSGVGLSVLIFVVHANGQPAMDRLFRLMVVMSWLHLVSH